MRWAVFSSTVGLGEVDTSARRAGLTDPAAVGDGAEILVFGGAGAALWDQVGPAKGPARKTAARSVDGRSLFACVKGIPLDRHRVARPRQRPSPRRLHNAL